MNDFEKLLALLFAKTIERDAEHTKATRAAKAYVEVPDAPIDIIVKAWTELLPHRKVSFEDGKVNVNKDTSAYHGKDMSDGERVILYLLGQCLCALDGSIIIIDEPEIHIHKAIVQELWNKIEVVCPNKLLIYITHDLDFAASRTDAQKIWVKAYHEIDRWEWQMLSPSSDLPENLVLEVIGSRKKILFCEGEKGSMDYKIYQAVYADYHIIPRGGGEKVIEATKALQNNPSLHHLQAVGILDSDYKEEREKTALAGDRIFTIPVAEIENLILIEPVLRIIAAYLLLDGNTIVDEVTQFIIDALNAEFDVQVSSKAEKIVEYRLGAFSKQAQSLQGIIDGLAETNRNIDVATVYGEVEASFRQAIANRQLNELLSIYNRKSLADRIGHLLGLSKGNYQQLVLRLLKTKENHQLIDAFAAYLPKFP